MRWFTLGWFTTVLSLVLLLGGATLAEGKGKGRGGGSRSTHKRSHVHRSPTHHGSQRTRRPSTDTRSRKFNSQVPTGRNGVLARQRANEQRKLEQRLGQADHLRSVAERNGNEKLIEAADKMELKAHEHYEKRMAKIDEKTAKIDGKEGDKRPPDPDDDDGFTDDNDGDEDLDGDLDGDESQFDDAEDPTSRDAGQLHARRQQLRNEERKLNHRLEQADHLRSIAERNGNARLLEAADRMEEKALEHYTRRLDTIDRQFSPQPPQPIHQPIHQPVLDEALDRLRSPARSYFRGLLWP